MDTILWILQILLGAMFTLAGLAKSTQPKDSLYSRGMKYVEDFSATQIKGIGVLEVLGGVGLILPWALNIVPVLTPIAALGLAIVMAGATYTHVRRGESPAFSGVLLVLSAIVAIGRFSGAV